MVQQTYGHVLTLEQAEKLGVLDAAEGFCRDGPDKPWEVIRAADQPVVLDGDGKEQGDNMAEEKAHSASLHRALSHLHKGGLHRALGVPEGELIPADKLAAAKNSTNDHVKKMANFASVLKGFHH